MANAKLSTREQAEKLFTKLRDEEQPAAITEATAYFSGEECAAFEAKLAAFRAGVVPGEVLDKALGNILNAIEMMRARVLTSPAIQAKATPDNPTTVNDKA